MLTRTINLSATGAQIKIDLPMRVGEILWLSLPMPVSWRHRNFTDQSYDTYCKIIWADNAQPPESGSIGVRFISDNKANARRKKSERQVGDEAVGQQLEKRREERFSVPIEFTIQCLDEFGRSLFSESTVTETISRKGACLLTQQEINVGDIIMVLARQDGFKSLALVRGVFTGKDGINRINVEFSGNQYIF